MLNIVFMGKSKSSSLKALEILRTRNCKISAVVAPAGSALEAVALQNQIPRFNDAAALKALTEPVDLIISFLYWKRIPESVIRHGRLGCVNFHPAPLPDYRGVGGYNFAILDCLSEWGVSAHYVDKEFDTGDVIRVRKFSMNAEVETAFTLEEKSQEHLVELYTEVLDLFLNSQAIPRLPQGAGRYIHRSEFENARRVEAGDTPEIIDRKIRAFWFPPFDGAFIEKDGVQYTLVNKKLLGLLAKR